MTDDPAAGAAVDVFERHRPRLLRLAYRLLGRMGEAEEVVQDAFLRWFNADRGAVRDTPAFLMTTVTRLALDRLKSAHAQREQYVGPWLPEPLLTDPTPAGALDALEQQDLISLGLLRLLERLSAAERAVFVLREAFDLSYDEMEPCSRSAQRIAGSSFCARRSTSPAIALASARARPSTDACSGSSMLRRKAATRLA